MQVLNIVSFQVNFPLIFPRALKEGEKHGILSAYGGVMVYLYLLHDSNISKKEHPALGRRLLFHALSEHGYMYTDDDIAINEFGRPHIPGGPEFSISHSGRTVACALSDSCAVGVDVEEISHPRPGVADRFFTPAEHSYAANGIYRSFYEIWTRKESFIKMLGTGFATPLPSFDTVTGYGTNGAHFFTFTFGGTAGCVCTDSDSAVQTAVVKE